MLKPLPQILIDGLIRHFAQQRQIGHANLLLLARFEHGLSDLRPSPCPSRCAFVARVLRPAESALLFGAARLTLSGKKESGLEQVVRRGKGGSVCDSPFCRRAIDVRIWFNELVDYVCLSVCVSVCLFVSVHTNRRYSP